MKLAYFWLTPEGEQLAHRIQACCGGVVQPPAPFAENVRQAFATYDGLVCIMATGIVVRTIAPLLRGKDTDPAVVVLDQQGEYVVSLLSGHLGGANALTRTIAAAIGATPVITTATDVQQVTAFDTFAKDHDLVIENLPVLKQISSALLRGEQVDLYSDMPLGDAVFSGQVVQTDTPQAKYCVRISHGTAGKDPAPYTLYLRPKDLVVGVGCKKGIAEQQLEQDFLAFLAHYGLSPLSVKTIATIARKAQEPAILALCKAHSYALEIVPEEAIRSCSYAFARSAFVEQITGVPSVAEACSYLAAGENCIPISGKVRFSGITLAVCQIAYQSQNERKS
jgi:cobalt-precorrin 5A hydrolase